MGHSSLIQGTKVCSRSQVLGFSFIRIHYYYIYYYDMRMNSWSHVMCHGYERVEVTYDRGLWFQVVCVCLWPSGVFQIGYQ